ncbi:SIS domain-containing protein [Sphingomonas sp. Mn802worker]|uniref:SIS domain-containing protein n=1 Tax=Sphingomonas sp. Mn802worker TaxID=629773 RepID=UPI0003739B61|nr:SIS domain-containing protein [Sphingomonas sp. Mn802worker]
MTTRMFAEAAQSSAVVAHQQAANHDVLARLADDLRTMPPHVAMTAARGSSDHAATYLKHLIETRVGVLVASAAPSVASIYRADVMAETLLAIGVSQSGKSPDLLATMERAKHMGARTLALVNTIDSPLAEMVDTVLPLHAGAETSVAATKSFIATLAASLSLMAAWSGAADLADDAAALPDLLAQAWTSDWSPLVEALQHARGLYVIGRGPGFGAAQELALKLKETCGLHAEAFSAAEVRHGPMALIGPDLPLIVLRQQDESAAATDDLIVDALASGATVLVASDHDVAPGAIRLPLPRATPLVAPILAVQAFYRAANRLSLARGFDPDTPPLLRKVTETV